MFFSYFVECIFVEYVPLNFNNAFFVENVQNYLYDV